MLDLAKVIAHRGASAYAPENTLVSLRRAHEIGSAWVECDIRISRDKELYIFHDAYLKRTTGVAGRFNQQPAKLIDTFDTGSWFSSQYVGERIPTFSQYLAEAARLNLSVNFELKTPVRDGELVMRELLKVMGEPACQLPHQLLFSTSSYKLLSLLQRRLPQLARALVIHRWPKRWLQKIQAHACYSVHVNRAILSRSKIELLKRHHFKVIAYTVNSKREAEDLFEKGVDAVFSDYPDLLTLSQDSHS